MLSVERTECLASSSAPPDGARDNSEGVLLNIKCNIVQYKYTNTDHPYLSFK